MRARCREREPNRPGWNSSSDTDTEIRRSEPLPRRRRPPEKLREPAREPARCPAAAAWERASDVAARTARGARPWSSGSASVELSCSLSCALAVATSCRRSAIVWPTRCSSGLGTTVKRLMREGATARALAGMCATARLAHDALAHRHRVVRQHTRILKHSLFLLPK